MVCNALAHRGLEHPNGAAPTFQVEPRFKRRRAARVHHSLAGVVASSHHVRLDLTLRHGAPNAELQLGASAGAQVGWSWENTLPDEDAPYPNWQ